LIKVFGTVYRFHPLFTVMMVLAVATGYFFELLTLFGIVLIHELGHVAAAKSFGWRIREVCFLPFGGVAVSEESGTVPAREEIIVALAGPAQHIWMVSMALLLVHLGVWDAEWAHYFIQGNLMIGLFNLIPVPPLDGGRIFQALCSYWMSYHRTIWLSALLGIALSVVMVGLALFYVGKGGIQLNMLVVGGFLLLSNWYSYRHRTYHFFRFLLGRDSLTARMIHEGTHARPIVVTKAMSIRDIVRMLMRERYHLIYVVGRRGTIQGVVPEQKVIHTFLDKNPQSAVSELL
jgi:stage IV sporulation protein FB